ncbi:hypothetical protein FRX31_019187 [Thalictrum thalictroides]|uniref:FAR1 domain-containing protein n=1 Tax=Thalictrum thalictroides TaxID=46969 RepID=A0A7J6W1F6_THATH|nr:hypothetical protein FRX31_019187 [Thalictrum thalictroides]
MEHNGSNVEDLSKKPTRDVVPVLGMSFDTVKEAYEYYNSYAFVVGFSVRKKRSNTSESLPKRIVKCQYCCSCEGKYKQILTPEKKRDERRFGCLAEFEIKLKDEKYVLTKFIVEHNHEFVLHGIPIYLDLTDQSKNVREDL